MLAVAPSSNPFGDERTRLTKGERWSYEHSKTCDSIRAVPLATACSIADEDAISNTASPSVNQRLSRMDTPIIVTPASPWRFRGQPRSFWSWSSSGVVSAVSLEGGVVVEKEW